MANLIHEINAGSNRQLKNNHKIHISKYKLFHGKDLNPEVKKDW